MELVDNRPQSHRFNCDWKTCNKGFKRKSDLQRHYRIHTNDRPFPCPAPGCESSFIQRSALTVHLRIHTGEKPYECQYPGCDKRFADSSSFSRHRRLHVGKRPYTCAVATCRKHFVRKVAMVQHHKLHHRANDDSKEFTGQYWNSPPRHDEVAATSTAVMMPPGVDAASRESPRTAGRTSSAELHSHDRAGVAERFAESPLANSYRQPYGRVHYDYSTADGQFFYDDSHSSQGSEQASSPIDDFASQQVSSGWPPHHCNSPPSYSNPISVPELWTPCVTASGGHAAGFYGHETMSSPPDLQPVLGFPPAIPHGRKRGGVMHKISIIQGSRQV
ncbi:Zinc finger protein 143 [Colletotrichum fructicola Nara gc5]|uniref:C2H2 type master regulator of conidiophore development brlA n=1 Tax=Colletotrichum fructicola (strain Nara gc5) TaxID=1213859 RepID=A0A7J6JLP4_COLFN|nr:Zinc finger protein 143 [Colletotrichum fructicola Nara gc5]